MTEVDGKADNLAFNRSRSMPLLNFGINSIYHLDFDTNIAWQNVQKVVTDSCSNRQTVGAALVVVVITTLLLFFRKRSRNRQQILHLEEFDLSLDEAHTEQHGLQVRSRDQWRERSTYEAGSFREGRKQLETRVHEWIGRTNPLFTQGEQYDLHMEKEQGVHLDRLQNYPEHIEYSRLASQTETTVLGQKDSQAQWVGTTKTELPRVEESDWEKLEEKQAAFESNRPTSGSESTTHTTRYSESDVQVLSDRQNRSKTDSYESNIGTTTKEESKFGDMDSKTFESARVSPVIPSYYESWTSTTSQGISKVGEKDSQLISSDHGDKMPSENRSYYESVGVTTGSPEAGINDLQHLSNNDQNRPEVTRELTRSITRKGSKVGQKDSKVLISDHQNQARIRSTAPTNRKGLIPELQKHSQVTGSDRQRENRPATLKIEPVRPTSLTESKIGKPDLQENCDQDNRPATQTVEWVRVQLHPTLIEIESAESGEDLGLQEDADRRNKLDSQSMIRQTEQVESSDQTLHISPDAVEASVEPIMTIVTPPSSESDQWSCQTSSSSNSLPPLVLSSTAAMTLSLNPPPEQSSGTVTQAPEEEHFDIEEPLNSITDLKKLEVLKREGDRREGCDNCETCAVYGASRARDPKMLKMWRLHIGKRFRCSAS